jgi:hypothetical protein
MKTNKIFLTNFLSALINVPNVTIESRVLDNLLGFGGPIISIDWGKDDDDYILAVTDYGYQFAVSMDELRITINEREYASTDS